MNRIESCKYEFLCYLERLMEELNRDDYYELKLFIKEQVEEWCSLIKWDIK